MSLRVRSDIHSPLQCFLFAAHARPHRAYAEWAIKSLPCNLAMAIVFYLRCARQQAALPPPTPPLPLPALPCCAQLGIAFFANLFDGFKLPTLLRLQKCISRCLSLSAHCNSNNNSRTRGAGADAVGAEATQLWPGQQTYLADGQSF